MYRSGCCFSRKAKTDHEPGVKISRLLNVAMSGGGGGGTRQEEKVNEGHSSL